MSEFIDTPSSPRTNQAVSDNGCPTCQGHRLIQLEDPEREVYARCPTCNSQGREPVQGARWQDYDR